MRVERLHQPKRSDVLFKVDMAAHRERVDAGIGAARRVQRGFLAGDAFKRLLDRLLHARPMLLALETLERCPIELEG